MAVMVKVVNKQSIFMSGIRTIPRKHLTTPITGMSARSNSIIESYSMNKNPTTFQGKWMVRHFLLSIAFRVTKRYPCLSSPGAFHPGIVKLAISVLSMGAVALWDTTMVLNTVMVYVAIMFQAPSVHLAKSLPRATLFAFPHRAVLWRIIELTSARVIAKLRSVRIIFPNSFLVSTISTSDDFCSNYISHERFLSMCIIPYLIARQPSFYGATFCAHCGKHLPVDEFVWEGTNEQLGS
jgi:hypothetical protein